MTAWKSGPHASEPGATGWTVVHDFAYVLAGAERVSQALANHVLPGSPLVAIAGKRRVLDAMDLDGGWRTLLPADLPGEAAYRWGTPLYPAYLRSVEPLPGHVICSSYAFSHHVRAEGRKVVYCHTPMRQVWSGHDHYLQHLSGTRRLLLRASTERLRRHDRRAAAGADLYVAASGAVRSRIEHYYGRKDVAVVTPPLDTSVFCADDVPRARDYFLWVGRVVEPYKRLEMTIDAFRGLPHRLVVAGDGRDRRRLEATAPANVTFVGWRGDNDLAELYRGARAVIFPSEDDFGLVPVESMACGTPSVAYSAGGARETVVAGESGVFFDDQTSRSLRRAVVEAASSHWDHRAVAARGASFGMSGFVTRMQQLLEVGVPTGRLVG